MLRRETFYELNRYYLIGTALLSFVLPVLQIGYLSSLFSGLDVQGSKVFTTEIIREETMLDQIIYYAIMLIKYSYISVVILLSAKFIKGLYHILSLAWVAPKERVGNIIQIELDDPQIAFSFFHLLFLNPRAEAQDTILKHELVHIEQKHSVDVILFEMLLIINWFNPVSWFLKKDIQIIHEYIADEQTTAQTLKKHEYAMFLIHNSFGQIPNPLSNQLFNQSILKMRINMLNKEKSPGSARLRFLLALPLAAAMVCSSSMAFTKDYATLDLYSSNEDKIAIQSQDTLKLKPKPQNAKARVTPAPASKSSLEPKTVIGKPTKKTIKFPPPIVTPNPPTKEVPAPKVEKIKFPPPVAKKTKPNPAEAPAPPPVEPPSPKEKSE